MTKWYLSLNYIWGTKSNQYKKCQPNCLFHTKYPKSTSVYATPYTYLRAFINWVYHHSVAYYYYAKCTFAILLLLLLKTRVHCAEVTMMWMYLLNWWWGKDLNLSVSNRSETWSRSVLAGISCKVDTLVTQNMRTHVSASTQLSRFTMIPHV